MGKTALVETFLEEVRSGKLGSSVLSSQSFPSQAHDQHSRYWLAQGQCIEQYGAGEAYMPVLAALGRLCRGADGQQLKAVLQQHAPLWLLQMPAVLSGSEEKHLRAWTHGATRERMLREMAETLEVLTAETPLILMLEDLHWSDAATVALLALLARRREPARLLILGTYRLVSDLHYDHPLRSFMHEGQRHGLCQELSLPPLKAEAVQRYLSHHIMSPEDDVPALQRLAHAIHQRTEGNPLFVVQVVQELMTRRRLQEAEPLTGIAATSGHDTIGIPENTRQMILAQCDQLSAAARRTIETASVVGIEFSAAAVAAGLDTSIPQAETLCEELVRGQQLLQRNGVCEWPDGTMSAQYRFVHALYQEVLYERIPAGRSQALHLSIGERLAVAYGGRSREIAAELAMHFEHGYDYARALQYTCYASETALRRVARHETIHYATKGLGWISRVPPSEQTTKYEVTLHLLLAHALTMKNDYNTLATSTAYERARVLSHERGEYAARLWALLGLHSFHAMRAEFDATQQIADEVLHLARATANPPTLLAAQMMLGANAYWAGDLVETWRHLGPEIPLANEHQCFEGRTPFLCLRAQVLAAMGYLDQAVSEMQYAISIAREIAAPFNLAYGLSEAATFFLARREFSTAHDYAEKVIQVATDSEFSAWQALGMASRGAVLAAQGQLTQGLTQIQDGLALYHTTGARLAQPHLQSLLARAYMQCGQRDEALRTLDTAFSLAKDLSLHVQEPGLWLVKGTLLVQAERKIRINQQKSSTAQQWPALRRPSSMNLLHADAAEVCFQTARALAIRQGARWTELQATLGLTRVWQQLGRQDEAHVLLSEIYTWFTEGFATKDLQEAKTLLHKRAANTPSLQNKTLL